MKTQVIAGQPSWPMVSDRVELAVARTGGQLAPVKFRLGNKIVEPFSIAPWAGKKIPSKISPMLRALRGDFFCAPFGGGEDSYRGEKHPPHGETANRDWSFAALHQEGKQSTLHLSLKTKIRQGRIDKLIQLRQGETNLYCRHVLSGMSGKLNLGHHAMLKFPEGTPSFLSTSRLRLGQVYPGVFEDPAGQGYQSLKKGAYFSSLAKVPSVFSGFADLSSYPARRGFDDLVMAAHRDQEDFAWTAVTFPEQGYVWFSLKDPRVLQSTVFWLSNGGRHYPPWNGQHVNVMGVEDVTSYFHEGLNNSCRPNAWNRKGIPTALALNRNEPLLVNYIMGVARIPSSFRRVKTILRGDAKITLISDRGSKVETPVDLSFLNGPHLL